MTVLIIGCALLRIGQDLISFFDFLKLILSLFIPLITIRVILHGQAFIGFLDFALIRFTGYAQNLIVVFLRHLGYFAPNIEARALSFLDARAGE